MDRGSIESQLSVIVLREQVEQLEAENAQLRGFLGHAKTMEQAVGAISVQYKMPPSDAFELLRGMARSQRRDLRELASEVLDKRGRFIGPRARERTLRLA